MISETQAAYLRGLRERDEAGERWILQLGPWSDAMIPAITWYATEKGDQPPVPSDDELTDLLRRERAGERFDTEIGPYSALLLAWAINGVIRHQDFKEYGPEMFRLMLDQLTLMFIDDPEGAELLRAWESAR
ncbi:hypothetical protein DMC64_41820 [Amycolatopsis sp. WAC 04197]|uniref:hypothetical protein n=1 Tax=Amycolatopsis sp. WAC 04197 TaxID=2203199 RepID=UPI000F782F60|nr:hypothetical protein [Amycolatopsis sp. WAC 04197]RSN38607.1 hypothetical protein DMC64_41820 [Amycolatopsis sp. WAC 04197]